MPMWLMRVAAAFVAVGVLLAVGFAGGLAAPWIMGVAIPYLALAAFIVFFIARVVKWGKAPTPFRIPTTCGQQKSLPWIKSDELEAPATKAGVLARMALEVLLFRSLFRNTRAEIKKDRDFAYVQEMFLWGAALAFHYTFLVIVLRHFRFFMEPVPFFAVMLAKVDGFFELLMPTVFLSNMVILGALGFLFVRRIIQSEVRYISLMNDYFPLALILTIVATGMSMRHVPFLRVDVEAVKILAIGLFSFHPPGMDVIGRIGPLFFAHLFLVSTLIAYFPFSKLMHMPGVFMSPTRNLANNSRVVRHINPWNPDVKVHTYEEWEDEFRDLMKDAGMPLEKE